MLLPDCRSKAVTPLTSIDKIQQISAVSVPGSDPTAFLQKARERIAEAKAVITLCEAECSQVNRHRCTIYTDALMQFRELTVAVSRVPNRVS